MLVAVRVHYCIFCQVQSADGFTPLGNHHISELESGTISMEVTRTGSASPPLQGTVRLDFNGRTSGGKANND